MVISLIVSYTDQPNCLDIFIGVHKLAACIYHQIFGMWIRGYISLCAKFSSPGWRFSATCKFVLKIVQFFIYNSFFRIFFGLALQILLHPPPPHPPLQHISKYAYRSACLVTKGKIKSSGLISEIPALSKFLGVTFTNYNNRVWTGREKIEKWDEKKLFKTRWVMTGYNARTTTKLLQNTNPKKANEIYSMTAIKKIFFWLRLNRLVQKTCFIYLV